MRAFEIASDQIALGKSDIALVVGAESMSRVPHLMVGSRKGYRMGTVKVIDSLLYDALEDAFIEQHMGVTAENVAAELGITREEQDELAYLSHMRAVAAQKEGKFNKEIVPVEVTERGKTTIVDKDECPNENTTVEILSKLKPAFIKDGTVTAGNAGLELKDIDYFEVNEAFAAQFLAVKNELGLSMDNTNANGSGISLGHPVGCTGLRIIVSLISEMERRNSKIGCASLCVGGGSAMASIIEML